MSDKYGYIGIETLLDCCQNSKDHSITPNDIMRLKIEPVPKFSRITVHTDERWLKRKFDTFKDRLYLNEKTMIIYVPFVSFELISKSGGTIKRIGEEE